MLARYGRVLAQLIDPERFPALGEAIAAGVFDPTRDDTGASQHFEFGLARVLDGIAALEGAAPGSGQRRRRTSVSARCCSSALASRAWRATWWTS